MNNLKLEKVEAKKWYKNLWVFALVVLGVYLTQILGFIQANNGALEWSYFVPTPFTLGSMVTYVINAIIDYTKKLQSS